MITPADKAFLLQAVRLANQAGQAGNLPIGAVVVLDGAIVAEGMNAIWKPEIALTRHAEMEALRGLSPQLAARAHEMILYTTLEPCLMCAGAILLNGLGGLIFGSRDPYGGVSTCIDTLSPFFKKQLSKIQWIGPAMPEVCDPLYQQIKNLEGF